MRKWGSPLASPCSRSCVFQVLGLCPKKTCCGAQSWHALCSGLLFKLQTPSTCRLNLCLIVETPRPGPRGPGFYYYHYPLVVPSAQSGKFHLCCGTVKFWLCWVAKRTPRSQPDSLLGQSPLKLSSEQAAVNADKVEALSQRLKVAARFSSFGQREPLIAKARPR